MKFLLLNLIALYQKTISPDHGWFKGHHPHGYCRYHPTCSEYAKQSIIEHGVIRGGFLMVARILRCHPWADPRVDLVLNKEAN